MVLPSPRVRLALVPLATSAPPISHDVDASSPSASVAVALTETVSPVSPSVSTMLRLPPIIATTGATFAITGATTVMVTLVLVLSPSSSVARNVTVVLPSPRVRLALVPLATSAPLISHELDATLPSESVAVAVKDTASPAAASVSSIVRFPSEMDTAGAALNALSLMPKEFNEVGMLPLREL